MKTKHVISITLAAFVGGPAMAAETPGLNADQLLRQMSSKLASAQNFSCEAIREIDPQLLGDRNIPEKARVSATVLRPNKLAAKSASKSDTRHFIADGKTLTLFDEKTNHYAVVPMRTSIDGLVEQVDKVYGFVPPLAEFLLSDPYKDLRRQSKSITYLGSGRTKAGFLGLFGVECHRIWLSGKEADAELWIGVDDQLPHQMTATFHLPGNPQLRLSFVKWNLAESTPVAAFTFTPPEGAQKIEMWTTARMRSANKR